MTQCIQRHYINGSPDRKGLEAALQGYEQTREIPDIINGKEQQVRKGHIYNVRYSSLYLVYRSLSICFMLVLFAE